MPASNLVQVTLQANTEQQAIGPSDKRKSITFTTASATVVYLRNDSQGTAIGGLCVGLNTGPLILDRETHGDIVCKPWFALAAALTQLGIVETIY